IVGLGLDVERARPLEDRVVALVCSETERVRIAALPGLPAGLAAMAVFCAKESAYKCHYPLARTFLDFHDVEITLEPERGTFTADGRYLVTFPSRPTAKGAWVTAGVVAATALTIKRDQAIRDNIVASDRPGATRIATKFEPLGRQEVEAAALGILYLAGRGGGSARVVATAAR